MTEEKKIEFSPSVSIIAAGVLIAGAIVFAQWYQPGEPATPAAVGDAVPTSLTLRTPSSGDHIIGSPNAPVVIVEFSDFECPYCALFHPIVRRVVEESNGTVAWVYRHLPLGSIHAEANPAALASECVADQLGNDGFWKFADAMFADQSKLGASYYASTAALLGANPQVFATCMKQATYQERIDTDIREAIAAGVKGTPFTAVINTKTGGIVPISGVVQYDRLMGVISSITK